MLTKVPKLSTVFIKVGHQKTFYHLGTWNYLGARGTNFWYIICVKGTRHIKEPKFRNLQGLIKGYHRYRRYYTAGFIPYQYLLCSSLQCPTTRSSDVGISHHRKEGNTPTSKGHPVVAMYQVCPVIFSNPVFETYREVNCLYQKVTMSAIVLEVYCTCCTVV